MGLPSAKIRKRLLVCKFFPEKHHIFHISFLFYFSQFNSLFNSFFFSVCTRFVSFVLMPTRALSAYTACGVKKLHIFWKKPWKNFVSSRNCRTFALAFGKISGASMKRSDLWHTANSNKAAAAGSPLMGVREAAKQTRYVDSFKQNTMDSDRADMPGQRQTILFYVSMSPHLII